MRIALAQLDSGADPRQNLRRVGEEVVRAADAGADLVVFPEATMRAFGYPLDEIAEPLDGPWAASIQDLAAEHALTIVVGMFTPGPKGRVRNTALIASPRGAAHYDKIHLFDAFDFAESRTVEPGAEVVTVDLGGVRVGLAICYDVRFPALFTQLAHAGAEVIVLPASWGAGPRKREQWRVLVQARAMDTGCFVAACGQPVAREPRGKAPTGIGHSMLVAPDGVILAELDDEPGLLIADVDPALVAATRRSLPVLANRRVADPPLPDHTEGVAQT